MIRVEKFLICIAKIRRFCDILLKFAGIKNTCYLIYYIKALLMDDGKKELPDELKGLKFTPENITSLGPDEVFVFGSNLRGLHCGGAAKVAHERFGAVMGQGEGMQGQSYAIPTMQGGVETIKPYVDRFIDLAREWDETTFYVTRIGCGIAGFKDEEIAPLFDKAFDLYNVRLPESFARIIVENRRKKNNNQQ